jgi:hypothetical protein
MDHWKIRRVFESMADEGTVISVTRKIQLWATEFQVSVLHARNLGIQFLSTRWEALQQWSKVYGQVVLLLTICSAIKF